MKANLLISETDSIAREAVGPCTPSEWWPGSFIWAAVFLGAAWAWPAHSGDIAVNVLDTQYTIALSTFRWTQGTNNTWVATNDNSRTSVSVYPIGDVFYQPVTGLVEAQAGADLFQVGAYTDAVDPAYDVYRAAALATAKSELWFTPLTSANQEVRIDCSGWYQWFYSEGSMTLSDLTAQQQVWNYSWTGWWDGNIPWVVQPWSNPPATAVLTIPTSFNAAHAYVLTLYARTDSEPPDREQILVRLSGIAPVPDPSARALVERLIFSVSRAQSACEQPLLATLQTALASIENDNVWAAANQLLAFQRKVGALSKRLDPSLARSLVDTAQQAIDSLRNSR